MEIIRRKLFVCLATSLAITELTLFTGIKKFIRDIELMLGKRHIGHWMYFIVCWMAVTPLSLVVGIL